MPKKRLIFTLLYQEDAFYLSRNFRLQRVGDLEWLSKNYEFSAVANSIDELIILDVSRGERNIDAFCNTVAEISANCFIPLALGGGITTAAEADRLISSGADKLVLNTTLTRDPDFVTRLIDTYGSQCIIASIDYRIENGACTVYINQGQERMGFSLESYLCRLEQLKVGEIYLNCIDHDGTGTGYHLDSLEMLPRSFNMPLIIAGGAGNQKHLLQGLDCSQIDAAATANLFNFVGDGLPRSRAYLLENGVSMARW